MIKGMCDNTSNGHTHLKFKRLFIVGTWSVID